MNPKVPDQIAHYSRQLYTYNCTIVQGSSKSKMSKENIFIYTWMEQQHAKGSNEIASALFHCLSQVDLSGYSTIRLCADGCGGQNRNSTMICMCIYFLLKIAHKRVRNIELIFPIPGHSFLPSDRVFGRIEKALKKIPVIADPQVYIDVFSQHGSVVKLGSDCPVKNWKVAAGEFMKPPGCWHFKFSLSKRFVIQRSRSGNNALVRGEMNYMSDFGSARSVSKKGKDVNMMSPTTVTSGIAVKAKKLNDVKKLLEKHFGMEWQTRSELEFYKELLIEGGCCDDGDDGDRHEEGSCTPCDSALVTGTPDLII